jgi:rubredoxin
MHFRQKGEKFECPICHKMGVKKTGRQEFCSVKCYRVHYKKLKKSSDFPYFVCPECHFKEKLDFMPSKRKRTWESYRCKNCGILASFSEI